MSSDAARAARVPRFWQRLSPPDQQAYLALRAELATPKFSNQRGRSDAQFAVMLDLIRAFVVRGDAGDLARSLVCGVLWMSGGIAVNIQQMRLLTSKCKSSINGSLGHLRYLPVASGADTAGELLAAFPFMKDHFGELRQWTIRQLFETKAQQLAFDRRANPFERGFSLEDEYLRLALEDCPCGSLSYVTPPADFGPRDDGAGIGLEVKDHGLDIDRGLSDFPNDFFSMS
jgi:hypothetical protein